MTSLITQEKLDEFQINIDLLERGIRNHVLAPLGQVHVPRGGLRVIAAATYKNSAGTLLGNATLAVTLGEHTYYVPARIIT
jgi:hypothetical protein